jgi:hypothetical protein
MKVIIAGSRENITYDDVVKAISQSKFVISTVISGTARGVDRFGEKYASENCINIEKYPADWDKYGKSAGYRRNELMATKADALIAVWDGQSKGTKHMIDIAKKNGLSVFIYVKDKI